MVPLIHFRDAAIATPHFVPLGQITIKIDFTKYMSCVLRGGRAGGSD